MGQDTEMDALNHQSRARASKKTPRKRNADAGE